MGYDRGDSFPFDFLNQMEFQLVQNRKENCHQDHIPINLKELEIQFCQCTRKINANVRACTVFARVVFKFFISTLNFTPHKPQQYTSL